MASDGLDDAEKAALRWAEILTLKLYQAEPGRPSQSPEAMADLKKHFSDGQIVELTLASAYFNFWNRFTDSLQIDLEEEKTRDLFEKSKTIDPADYIAFMKDCWWNKER
jgi:alkylhydroperoxidase family enzyme